MSASKRSKSIPRHPMFRALVVMGNGLALGCGGVAKDQQGKIGDGPHDNGGSGGSDAAGAGGQAGSGGMSIASTGGTNPTVGSGGELNNETGGTTTVGAGGSITSPPSCPPAQYDCSDVTLDCNGTSAGWVLPSCKCDSARPLLATDCPGQAFVCREATTTADGKALDPPIGFECTCVPTAPSCGAACDAAYLTSGPLSCADPAPSSNILCGCAIILLR